MGAAAGLEVEALGLHQADLVARLVRGVETQGLGLPPLHDARADRARVPDDRVAAGLGSADGVLAHLAVQVDGGHLGAEVEAQGGRGCRLHEGPGEEVLAVVLLHVVAPPLGVDAAAHGGRRQGRAQDVQHLAVLLHHRDHGHPVERARIPGLPAALRVEGGAVQDHRRTPFVLAAGHDHGLELQQIGIVAVQPARHGPGALTTEGPSPPRT
jgi:hypothetical protein